jgi:signal transduction histidine kinase
VRIKDLSKIDEGSLNYRFDIVVRKGIYDQCFISDLDNDGIDDLIMVTTIVEDSSEPARIILSRGDLHQDKFQKDFFNKIEVSDFFFDINQDGKKEIFVAEQTGDIVKFHALNYDGEIIYSDIIAEKPDSVTVPGKENVPWICSVKLLNVIDGDEDGHLDLVFRVSTFYAYQPRGLYVYSIRKKKLLWRYLTGFYPLDVTLYDVDADGKMEIVFGSSSPGNGEGIEVNGTDDDHTYITVINNKGEEIRCDLTGSNRNEATRLYFTDLNADGKNEIIYRFSSHAAPKKPTEIGYYNPITGNISPLKSIHQDITDIEFYDLNRDGIKEVIYGQLDGVIQISSKHLNRLKAIRFNNFFPNRIKVTDLNNDENGDIVISGDYFDKRVLIILDRNLKIQALIREDLNLLYHKCIVNIGYGQEKLLATRSREWMFFLKMIRQRSFSQYRGVLYGFLLGMLVLGIVLYVNEWRKLRRKSDFELKSVLQSIEMGILIINPGGYILFINNKLENLIDVQSKKCISRHYKKIFTDHLSFISEIINDSFSSRPYVFEQKKSLDIHSKTVDLIVNVYPYYMEEKRRYGRLILFRHQTESPKVEKAIAWAYMAQRLAHEIKTPLTTVLLSAQHLQMESVKKSLEDHKINKYVNRIINESERLQKSTDSLLKLANVEKPEFKRTDLNELIVGCLEAYKVKMGSGIKVKTMLGSDLSKIRVDKNQIKIVLQNIFDNSLDAMQGKGVITVVTRMIQSLDENSKETEANAFQAEISDTGVGIPRENLDKLFQPFYSNSSNGTGLGLMIVKKIIEDHKGTVRIKSEVNIGTTVIITLPA